MNPFTLVHETAHQLSFNTGIFNRQAVVHCVCRRAGHLCRTLAATGEERDRWSEKSAAGGPAAGRGLHSHRRPSGRRWIVRGDREQLAYAECWLLVHYLLRATSRQPRFRQVPAESRAATREAERTRIAEKVFGSLAKLDREIKDEARKYRRA